jgi:adenosylcobyric acid synthase
MTARTLMLQGTGSDVGKSLLAAGLARAYTRRGLKVRPFKPQNMSNNAAVSADGGEIGRAQALQALACGIAPLADMNPVLLKPQSERGAQIVLGGRVWGQASAADYRRLAPSLLPMVLAAFARLAAGADLVLVEGAGSPAEINLRDGDIANMGFAQAADVPVVLIGDIERGGVIAQIFGTQALLREAERALLAGYIVNKFRGDPRLFDGGIAALGAHTGLTSFGVVPFFPAAAALPAEDSLALSAGTSDLRRRGSGGGRLRIAVPVLPHIANFDDFDPLRAEPNVDLDMVRPGRPLPRDASLVILPGSKATIADLEFLRREGWDIDILAHRRQGGRILGLCGGYQMLGQKIVDPQGIEGCAGTAAGLGLLDIETVLTGDKRLALTTGTDVQTNTPVAGYEMHLGITTGPGCSRPMLRLAGGADGSAPSRAKPGTWCKSRRPSMRSPIISKPISIFRRCSPRPGRPVSERRHEVEREPGREQETTLDQAGATIETERAEDVRGRGAGAAVAEPGIGDDALPIAARPGQGQTERPGHRTLRPAGVQRPVLAPVAQHDRHGMARTTSGGKNRGGGDKEPAEPGRHQVQAIVETRRRPAEGAVAPIAVPDHAVEGIRHLVGEEKGQPADEIPEHRRHDAVAEVFRQALDRRAGDAMGIEARRIAADDMADRRAPGGQSAGIERPGDGGDMLVEAALGEEDGDHQHFDDGAGSRAAAQELDGEPEERGAARQYCHGDDAAAAARGFAANLAVELPVAKGDGAAGERHRMRHPAEQGRHVAERGVDGEAGDEQQQRIGSGRDHGGASLGRGCGRVNR